MCVFIGFLLISDWFHVMDQSGYPSVSEHTLTIVHCIASYTQLKQRHEHSYTLAEAPAADTALQG